MNWIILIIGFIAYFSLLLVTQFGTVITHRTFLVFLGTLIGFILGFFGTRE